MATLNEYYPQEVLHPCKTLSEKLKEMGISRKEFALRTGKPEKTIIAVLKGESSITPEMAVLFENITKIPAHFWINKQARYNEYKARKQRKHAVEDAEVWTLTKAQEKEVASSGSGLIGFRGVIRKIEQD